MAKRKKKLVHFDLWGKPIEEATPSRSSEIIPLDFETHPVRVILIKGEPWWVLVDVARALGYRRPRDAARILRDNHKGAHRMRTLGGTQELTVINEAGLYRLMMRSDKPEAERFQDWVTDEVLPTIRKTGAYSTKPKTRVDREVLRLKCDASTAKVRCDQFTMNLGQNLRLASEGSTPNDHKEYHNSGYRGMCEGMEAKDLRRQSRMKRGTPLDRMDVVLLTINLCAKAIVERLARQAREEGRPMTIADQAKMLETVSRELTELELKRFGPEAKIGFTDDPRRGLILDVVQRQLSA